MKKFSFQLHFTLENDAAAREQLAAALLSLILEHENIVQIDKNEDAITILVESSSPVDFWRAIKPDAEALPVRKIVVCEGDHGWDDYFLLMSFYDEKLDDLT